MTAQPIDTAVHQLAKKLDANAAALDAAYAPYSTATGVQCNMQWLLIQHAMAREKSFGDFPYLSALGSRLAKSEQAARSENRFGKAAMDQITIS